MDLRKDFKMLKRNRRKLGWRWDKIWKYLIGLDVHWKSIGLDLNGLEIS